MPSPAAVLVNAPSPVEVKSGSVKATKCRGSPRSKFLHTVTLPCIDHSLRVVAAVPLPSIRISSLAGSGADEVRQLPSFIARPSPRSTIHDPVSTRPHQGVFFGKAGPRREHGLPRRLGSRSMFPLRLPSISRSPFIDDKIQTHTRPRGLQTEYAICTF